jgi:predicted membrane-bound mannosyltransferase
MKKYFRTCFWKREILVVNLLTMQSSSTVSYNKFFRSRIAAYQCMKLIVVVLIYLAISICVIYKRFSLLRAGFN